MQNTERLLEYLKQGIDDLLKQGTFDNGWEFKPTQNEALHAYKNFLNDERLTPEQRLKGYFEIPTGVGKTAVFIGIVAAAHKAAEADGQKLKTAIVVPTTQLLHQTHEAFENFAPSLHKHIGLYGDGHKSLKRPLTIMTYNAWYDLSQAGTIGSHNIDILISDEAHRGTSERRIDSIKGAFNDATAQIAFTATAHFDDEKSVEGSHEREIFYKSIRDAVLEGELAAYIQSQRAIIRVNPTDYMLTEDFENAAEGEQIKYRALVRQKTWNDFALKAFREGHDERTGDLLTDNDAGFFVGSTRQADELEEMLNADPELQKRAKERGKKGVAIAIHTVGMSAKEQKRRFEAYLRGEYMAVVGDEKFKEGFDHPPMKTLFDYHRASLVDKAQIIGRGARKWWNEAKGRYEGLTIIDTAIYIGSPDPEVDEINRNAALRTAISVKDILEESALDGPDVDEFFDKRKKGSGRGGWRSGGSIFDDNPNIEYVTDLEDIYALESDVSRIRREHLIPITDEMRAELSDQFARTAYGSRRILQLDGTPDGLSSNIIQKWFEGSVQQADSSHWDWVINKYKSLPTALNVTDKMREELKEQAERTGVSFEKILEQKSAPETLKASRLYSKLNSLTASEWEWIMSAYQALPTGRKVPLTEEMVESLNDEIERTKVTITKLAERDDAPLRMGDSSLYRIVAGRTKKVNLDFWNWIMAKYKELPDAFSVTEEMRKQLTEEVERTGVGFKSFVQLPDCPKGLKSDKLQTWRNGDSTAANPEEWKRVIETYQSLPTKFSPTKSMKQKVAKELERTKLSYAALVRMDGAPKNLTAARISDFAQDNNGTLSKEEYDWVIKTYQEQPDAFIITEKMRQELLKRMEATQIGPYKLSKQDGFPDDLRPHNIVAWSKGKSKTPKKEHWEWVMETYKTLEDKDAKPSGVSNDPEP